MNLLTIVTLAQKAIYVINLARQMGLTPKGELAEKILDLIAKGGALVGAAVTQAQNVDQEMQELSNELAALEQKLKAGGGTADLQAAFDVLDKRGEAALDRIAAAAKARGIDV